MIQAKKTPVFEALFSWYNCRLIKKHFHCIWLTKDSNLLNSGNAIYLINHSSWWDPLLLFYLNRNFLQRDGVAMMSHDGLARFPFFRKIGAFSVDRTSRKSIVASLQYASEQLKDGKDLFLFPQGEEVHIEQRPLQFFSGAAYLSEKHNMLPIIPITFYHSLIHHQHPEWFIHIGKPYRICKATKRKERTIFFEKEMELELNKLRSLVIEEQETAFIPLLKGQRGIGEKLESWKKRLGRGKLR